MKIGLLKAVDTAKQSAPTSMLSKAIWNTREVVKSGIDKAYSNKDTLLKVAGATTALVALGAAIYYASQNDLSSFFSSCKASGNNSPTQNNKIPVPKDPALVNTIA